MSISPSEHPGAHERHLLRKRGNPLFDRVATADDGEALAQARLADAQELDAFMQRFRDLLQRSMDLKPNEESEELLRLKSALDEAYTYAATLSGDPVPLQQGLVRLTATVMAAIRGGARDDQQALMELEQEGLARESHYRLLEHALVADLMRPDSPVPAEELVPTLLSESGEGLDAALWLFDQEQLSRLCGEGRRLLEERRRAGEELPAAWSNLASMEQLLTAQHSTGHSIS